MNKRKLTISLIVVVVLLLMVATAVILLLASCRPDAYQPYALTQAERKKVTDNNFTPKCAKLLSQLGNPDPFTHVITQDNLNLYLASLDEIAFWRLQSNNVGDESSELIDAMDKAGVAYPAVNMDDEVLTIMVRTEKINKVISIDLKFDVTDDGRVKVTMDGVRVGKMPVPKFIVTGVIDSMKERLAERAAERKDDKSDDDDNDVSLGDFDLLLPKILAAIDEEPFPTEIKFRKARKQVTDVDIDDGELRIHFIPVQRP
ncbi:MAG: hypothetical protein KAR11_05935 [Phycisphaerae bacterium]|nr:hypothetical protein [Phycisphaerae bacterium]